MQPDSPSLPPPGGLFLEPSARAGVMFSWGRGQDVGDGISIRSRLDRVAFWRSAHEFNPHSAVAEKTKRYNFADDRSKTVVPAFMETSDV